MLETTWFVLAALPLIAYAVLDGFDLGVGILHLRVAKTDDERRQVLRSIGPVWDGNEVWIVVGGATLFLAFPRLFGVAFSGFYLPLMMVLWLLVFRALGIEMRHLMPHRLFDRLWDTSFAVASALLAFGLGAALGNVVRGVSLDEEGIFFAPLWSDVFWPAPGAEGQTGVLDVFTVLCGLTTVAVLALHGALWLASRLEGVVAGRAANDAKRLYVAALVLTVALTGATAWVQPNLTHNLGARPVGIVFPALGAVSLAVLGHAIRTQRWARAFRASAAWIAFLIGSAAYAIFPYVLLARIPERSLHLSDAANLTHALTVALYWWIPGVLLGASYFVYAYRQLPARVPLHEDAGDDGDGADTSEE